MSISHVIRSMSPAEKVGQLLGVGFDGADLPARYQELLESGTVGNLILFRRNIVSPRQVSALTQAIQDAARRSRAGHSAAIMVDQEGGTVVRMPESTGFTHFPGARALGAAGSETLTYRAARVTGAELRAVGVNWNLAPVLDVNNNPANPVIGVRSFGSDPEQVSSHALAAIRGYQDAGLATSGKHFPGHGDTHTDSHYDLPLIAHRRERLDAVELVSFRRAIAAGVDAILTAHVYFPALEPQDGIPATLSEAVLTGLLRRELGFDGVISTDCLEMDAIRRRFTPEETALRALEAGVDLLLISHTLEVQMAMQGAILSAVRSGRLAEARLDESVARILRLKERRGMQLPQPAPDEAADRIGTAEHRAVAQEIAERAIGVLWDRGALPVRSALTMIQTRVGWTAGAEQSRAAFPDLIGRLEEAGLLVQTVDLPAGDPAGTGPLAASGSTVLIGLAGAAVRPGQMELVRRHREGGCRVISVARRMPDDLELVRSLADAGIAVYDDSPPMQRVLADVLLGRRVALHTPAVT
jgi:beta-N-acetylhexosaminidase